MDFGRFWVGVGSIFGWKISQKIFVIFKKEKWQKYRQAQQWQQPWRHCHRNKLRTHIHNGRQNGHLPVAVSNTSNKFKFSNSLRYLPVYLLFIWTIILNYFNTLTHFIDDRYENELFSDEKSLFSFTAHTYART